MSLLFSFEHGFTKQPYCATVGASLSWKELLLVDYSSAPLWGINDIPSPAFKVSQKSLV